MEHANAMISNKGQTTVESLAVLTALTSLTTLILFSTYFMIVQKWADYWVYRAAMCQAHTLNPSLCRHQLNTKMSVVILKHHYRWESGWVTRKESQVSITLNISSYFQKRITSKVQLPIGAETKMVL